MSRGIAGYTVKHGRSLSLIIAAIGIGVIGAYVTYPYSGPERAMMAKIGQAAAASGMSQMFVWTSPDH